MKKGLALLLIVLSAAMLFANGANEATTNKKDDLVKIKVAHHMGYSGAAVVATGLNMGYFAEEGLQVEPVPFTSGPSEIAAMVSGDIQFGYIGPGATTLAVKGDVEVIYFQNLGNSEVLVVNKDSGIKSVKDLKGKTVATTFGTSGENIVKFALEDAGMTTDDIDFINMDMGGCVTSILAGKVDAVCVWASFRVTVEQQLGDKYLVLARTSDFSDRYASVSSWLATQDYIDKNPETVQHFANAIAKSMDYWKDHEEQVATWVADLVNADAANMKDQIGTVFFMNSAELEKALNNGTIRKYYEIMEQSMYNNKQIPTIVPIDDFVKWEYMEKAIQNVK